MTLVTLLFEGGGSAPAASTSPKIIFLTNGHIALLLGGTLYQEL